MLDVYALQGKMPAIMLGNNPEAGGPQSMASGCK